MAETFERACHQCLEIGAAWAALAQTAALVQLHGRDVRQSECVK